MSSALKRSTYGRRTIATLVAAALTALLLALAPQAKAAKGMEVSLQDDAVFVNRATPFDLAGAYDLAKGLQVSRIRFNAVWAGLNDDTQCKQKSKPKTPIYDFSRLDAAIDNARARGMKVLVSITGPGPAWGNGKRKCNDPNKPKAKYFGQFAKVVAKRYKGRVDQYSIWNEPNHKSWLAPKKTMGTQYRSLYREGYRNVKAADKKAKVFIGELAPYVSKVTTGQMPLAFLRQLTCTNRSFRSVRSCPRLTTDGFAHHPYDFARSPSRRYPNRDAVTIANLGSLTSALDRLKRAKRIVPRKGSKVYLYLTEYGYFASRISKRNPLFKEKTRGKYLVAAFEKARRNSRVKQMLQFLLIQYPGAGQAGAVNNFDTSIVKLDGKKTKPYSYLAKWATKAADRKQIRAAPPTPTSTG